MNRDALLTQRWVEVYAEARRDHSTAEALQYALQAVRDLLRELRLADEAQAASVAPVSSGDEDSEASDKPLREEPRRERAITSLVTSKTSHLQNAEFGSVDAQGEWVYVDWSD